MMSKTNKGTLRENVTRFESRFDHFNKSKQNLEDEVLCTYPFCYTPYESEDLKVYEDMMGRRNRLHPACYQDGLRKGEYLKGDQLDIEED